MRDEWIALLKDTAAGIPRPGLRAIDGDRQRRASGGRRGSNAGPQTKSRNAPGGLFRGVADYCFNTPTFLNSSAHCGTCCLTLASSASGLASLVNTGGTQGVHHVARNLDRSAGLQGP